MAKVKFEGDDSDRSNKVRDALQTIPVNRGRIPKWVLGAVKAAVKTKRLPPSQFPLTSAGVALEHATKQLGGEWADHTGTIVYDSYDLLISEPYTSRIDAAALQQLEKFVKLVGGQYYLSTNSGHFPGETIRVVIGETEKAAAAFKSHEYSTMKAGKATTKRRAATR